MDEEIPPEDRDLPDELESEYFEPPPKPKILRDRSASRASECFTITPEEVERLQKMKNDKGEPVDFGDLVIFWEDEDVKLQVELISDEKNSLCGISGNSFEATPKTKEAKEFFQRSSLEEVLIDHPDIGLDLALDVFRQLKDYGRILDYKEFQITEEQAKKINEAYRKTGDKAQVVADVGNMMMLESLEDGMEDVFAYGKARVEQEYFKLAPHQRAELVITDDETEMIHTLQIMKELGIAKKLSEGKTVQIGKYEVLTSSDLNKDTLDILSKFIQDANTSVTGRPKAKRLLGYFENDNYQTALKDGGFAYANDLLIYSMGLTRAPQFSTYGNRQGYTNESVEAIKELIPQQVAADTEGNVRLSGMAILTGNGGERISGFSVPFVKTTGALVAVDATHVGCVSPQEIKSKFPEITLNPATGACKKISRNLEINRTPTFLRKAEAFNSKLAQRKEARASGRRPKYKRLGPEETCKARGEPDKGPSETKEPTAADQMGYGFPATGMGMGWPAAPFVRKSGSRP